MGGKHLKRVRAEKSKVHLKKRKLCKGQNVTQTAFTVKKIVAVEQLKKVNENEPVSSFNVPLKDLLIRLRHYNFNSRLKSLTGIKELLNKYPEILKGSHLKSVIEGLLELITDVEQKIRVTAINLLANIFDLVPPNFITPFNGILIVHLGCAMTHRTASVQKDSLKFIDVLIKYSPETIKHNFMTITQNFIRILKNCLNECHAGVFLPKGFQQNLIKTKTEILFRFYEFLSAGFYSDRSRKEIFMSRGHNVHLSVKQAISLRGTSDQYKQIPSLSLLSQISGNQNLKLVENDSDEFQSLCLLVIPLLFDTWSEFSPNQISSECVLSEDVGSLLSVLLKTLMLFYEKARTLKDVEMERWFVSNYGPMFKKSFMSNFPYLSTTKRRSQANEFDESVKGTSNDFLSQNLIICFLSWSFKVVNKSSQMETKMENYLINTLLMKNQAETEILLKVIDIVINFSVYKKSSIFLSNVVAAYNTTNNPELQLGLSKKIMQIVLEENDNTYLENHSVKQWMISLCERLFKSHIFVQEIETILLLINKPMGNEILRVVECKGEEIMRNLPNIKIEGASQLEGQKLIANILYRCNNKVLKELIENKNLANTNILHPLELKNYILDIFSQKLKIGKTDLAS